MGITAEIMQKDRGRERKRSEAPLSDSILNQTKWGTEKRVGGIRRNEVSNHQITKPKLSFR